MSMSLKRYLFLLIALLITVLVGIQLAFNHLMQQKIAEEVEAKSRTLSQQAIKLISQHIPGPPTPASNNAIHIRITRTPGKEIVLSDDYVFVTGDETQTVEIDTPVTSPSTQTNPLGLSRLNSNYTFAIGFEDEPHQQIVQFDPRSSRIRSYFSWLSALTIALGLTGLLLAYWLARHISTPLREMGNGFARLQKGDLGTQIPPSGVQEIRETLAHFNQMSARLAELSETEKRFSQQQHLIELGEVARGLAHTLRNPLNTIGLAMEQMAQPGLDDTTRSELATQVRQKITHLDKTIKALLNLTSEGVDRRQSVALNKVIDDVLMELSMCSSHVISYQPGGDIRIHGDPAELRSMLHTLVVNAVEASGQDSPIQITSELRDDLVVIRVCDQGEGVPPPLRQKLFKPNVSSKAEGAGMGLFILKRLCESYYGGSITLKDNSPQGTVAELTLDTGAPADE